MKRNKSPQSLECRLEKTFELLTPENTQTKKDNEIAVYRIIGSFFKNNLKKEEIIKKHRPFFSLKVIPNREIDKVYSSVEKIPFDKIDLVEEFKYEEEKFESKNIFETNSKSFGLSNFDVALSTNIFGYKQNGKYHQMKQNDNFSSNQNSKIYCINSIFISLFRTVIDFKDIKLAKQIYEELKYVENANATDKKRLLEKLVDKFGLYIPLELVIGGRMNISFVANNEEEKNIYHKIIQADINAKLGGGVSFLSGNLDLDYNNRKKENKFSKALNSVKNMSSKFIGGNYIYKNDLKNWIKSFNIDNLQVIGYKTLIPIYCFIPGLEEKLKICLKSNEDIVLHQIHDLIENDFKIAEQNLFEGSSANENSWSVGITNDNYKSFTILKERKRMKIIIKSTDILKKEIQKKGKMQGKQLMKQNKQMNMYIGQNEGILEMNMYRNPISGQCPIGQMNPMMTMNQNELINEKQIDIIDNNEDLYICGQIPDGCLICGWNLSTDANSKPYNIICSWKRKKELKIIGSRFFKFKVEVDISEIKNFKKDIEIEYCLDIFYINTDFLFTILNDKNKNNDNPETIILLKDINKINNIKIISNVDFSIIVNKSEEKNNKKEIEDSEKNKNKINQKSIQDFLNSFEQQQNMQSKKVSSIKNLFQD